MQTFELVLVGGGLLFVLLAIPLVQRRIPPNLFYGLAIPRTLNNPRVWYDTNAYSGKWLLVVVGVIAIAAVVFAQAPNLTVDSYLRACAAVIIASFGIAFWQTWRYASKT